MIYTQQIYDIVNNALNAALVNAIQTSMSEMYSVGGDEKNEQIDKFAKTFTEQACGPIAEAIMSAFKYVLANVYIYGTVLTMGGPTTQTARIQNQTVPTINGALPNTLGIKVIDDYKEKS
jgi:hypothetical protein